MALCLNFYAATSNGFYLNNVEGVITELWEDVFGPCCKVQIQGKVYTLSFAKEITLQIDGYTVKLWMGNGTNVQRNIAHICFDAQRDEIRILTRAVYQRIQNSKLQRAQ